MQAGAWSELPAALWNGAWQPLAQLARPWSSACERRRWTRTARGLQRALPWLGIAGAVAWIACTPFEADVPTLPIDRADATAAAVAALAQRGVVLGPEWKRLSGIRSSDGELGQSLAQRFVWREAGANAYRALSGNTLAPPMWEVRFARFDGDVAERAEEWWVTVTGDGRMRQVQHRATEAAPGASLERDAALALAQQAVRDRFGIDASTLQLRTADQVKRDARRDWTFVFADPASTSARTARHDLLGLAGGRRGRRRMAARVFVPEAWQRAETERDNRLQALKYAGIFATALGALAALVFAVICWNRGQCDRRAMWWVGGLVFAVAIVDMANAWPEIALRLLTTEPVVSQVATTVAAGLFASLVAAGLAGLLFGRRVVVRAHANAGAAGDAPSCVGGRRGRRARRRGSCGGNRDAGAARSAVVARR